MTSTNKKLLSDIAHLYYNEGLTQAEIAKIYDLSRPIVSRKLAEAKACGIVKIFIDSSEDEMNELEQELSHYFNLHDVKVASVPESDNALSVEITAKLGAEFLSDYIEPGDRVGFGWGWTLYEMSKLFPKMPISTEVVCQVTGSVDNAKTRGYANEIIGNMSKKLNAETAYTLPCPVMVDNSIISDTLQHDIKIKHVLEYGQSCNKLFVNIALPDESSCLYHAGYLNDNDITHLQKKDAVGSLCCRFYNSRGEICDKEMDARTMGITIDDIKAADCVLACITGERKAQAVYTALKAGMINVLVVDSQLAKKILEIAKIKDTNEI